MKSLVLLLLALVPLAFSWNRHMENQGLFEGDIDFSPEDMALAKIGMNMFGSIRDYLWKDGKVPYVIEGSLMQEPKARKGIQAAIDDYHKYTCIKFMKVTMVFHCFFVGMFMKVSYEGCLKIKVSLTLNKPGFLQIGIAGGGQICPPRPPPPPPL